MLVLFVTGPALLQLEDTGIHWWFNAGWILSPALGTYASLRAARFSQATDRQAWLWFAVACAMWLSGTLYWAFFDLQGIDPSFPSWADAGYLLSCLFFVAGFYQFGSVAEVRRLQASNFAVSTCASALLVSHLLDPYIERSELDWFSILVAIAYPVLWIGTIAFGAICLLLYMPPRKRLVAAIVLGGIAAQAAADMFYGLDLLGAVYEVGRFFDSFWVIGFTAVVWAATEQTWQTSRYPMPAFKQAKWQQLGEAFVPVVAIALVLSTQLLVEAHPSGLLLLAIVPIAAAFIGALALREHWSVRTDRQLRMAAEESREDLESVLESTSDNVIVLDGAWRITYVNQRARELASGDRALVVGSNLWDIYPESRGSIFELKYREAMETQAPVVFEAHLPQLGRWFEVHAYPSPEALSIFFRDVTERRTFRDELAYLAQHDHLTGLHNRFRFTELLLAALEKATIARPTALLCLDLDEFKDVNDTMGHPVGDSVLRAIADRLRRCAGERNVVARLGGDEFSVVAEQLHSPQEAADLAERIISSLRQPYEIDGQTLMIGASIGIVLSPADGTDPDQLLRKADIALYSAKADGKRTYHFFDPAMAARIAERQVLKNDLGRALENGELRLAYQPLMNLQTGQVSGFEALLRWTHPDKGPIAPASFVPIAEETGLIAEIGELVLHQACREAAMWPDHISVAVNLSPVQFRNSSLPLRVARALAENGLTPKRLELEITETVLLEHSDANIAILQQLHELGVRIALDDFGTGYSSLSYLHRFPFNKIKIDRSFISELTERNASRAVVLAAISMGQTLGVTITAEGVETPEQLEAITAAGCYEAQGYLFSAPVEVEEIAATIDRLEGTSASATPTLRVVNSGTTPD